MIIKSIFFFLCIFQKFICILFFFFYPLNVFQDLDCKNKNEINCNKIYLLLFQVSQFVILDNSLMLLIPVTLTQVLVITILIIVHPQYSYQYFQLKNCLPSLFFYLNYNYLYNQLLIYFIVLLINM